MIKLIAALGPNGLIGKGKELPWHISSEFKHFKETTMGHTLFMGRETFESLPKKLPGRKHVVLSRGVVESADKVINSIDDAKKYFEENKNSKEVIFIAGGKFVYETFYMYADELIVSHIDTKATGDVFWDYNFTKYEKKIIKKEDNFTVYKYLKI